ncbi:anti-sigma factor family protein [Paenibacillus rigui]|uniref:Anti-sigma-W factor RsiW n=1 Tax=Paenibacillus rigui TaxID=554312 RepID=A0A229URY1_9BACL|nr:anti-sigma factor [Paenibacillus rigui]OXM86144.1 hypothetical protein CF651_13085 [Paenibacillus rigui]
MICQEVIELMQRYLDQDLDETEYNAMLRHIQQCDDCAELFQRLVSLSHELEQLPKVTPSYSLVDAIMPRLDRIDAGVPSVELPAAIDSAQPSDLAAASERSSYKAPVQQETGWRSRLRGLVSVRMIGGVVAAGLVLGFFIFEQQQKQHDMTNADAILLPSGSASQKSTRSDAAASTSAGAMEYKDAAERNQAESKASDGTGAASMDSANAAGADTPQTSAMSGGGAALKQSTEPKTSEPKAPASQSPAAKITAPANGAAASVSDAKPAETNAAQAPAPDSSQPSSVEGPVLNEQQRSLLDQPPLNAAASDAASLRKAPAGSEAQTAPPAEAVPSQQQPKMQITAPTQGFAASTDSGADAAAKKPEEAAGLYSLNKAKVSESTDASKTKTSLDGAFTAALSEDRYVVITDKQGKKIYTSHQWSASAQVTLGEWSADNKLTYQITENQQKVTYVLDPVKQTDAKQG